MEEFLNGDRIIALSIDRVTPNGPLAFFLLPPRSTFLSTMSQTVSQAEPRLLQLHTFRQRYRAPGPRLGALTNPELMVGIGKDISIRLGLGPGGSAC